MPQEYAFYFAYGSNMVATQMRQRVPSATRIGTGYIADARLVFDVPAVRRRGHVANLRRESGARVWGVIWRIRGGELQALDELEVDYRREGRTVVDQADGPVECEVYVANSMREGRPEHAYLELLKNGAAEAALPESYLEELSAIETL